MPAPDITLPRTSSILEQGIRNKLHLGAQLYVSLRDEVRANAAVGESRLHTPMQTESLLLWMSSVKPVTAVAIGQLQEQGKLHLDDLVARYIPEFATGGKETVTLRHLLTHTGGFRPADKVSEAQGWEETIRRICETPLEPGWVPGQKAGYHLSSSWFVLGEVLRRLDGRLCGQYVREEIFEPLGLHDSWLGVPLARFQEYGERMGLMYLSQQGTLTPHPFWNTPSSAASCRPASNGRGPIHELGRFYENLLKTRQGQPPAPALLKTETVQLFTSRQRIGLVDDTFMHQMDWGLGFMVNSNRYGAETVPYGFGRYCSEETFGHSGAQSSSAFADPLHGLVVAWACNGMPGERLHQQRARAINSAIYQDLGLA